MSRVSHPEVGKAARVAAVILVAMTVIVSCTDQLSGPGTFLAVVTPPDGAVPGAVVIEFQGGDLSGVAGVGGTETFWLESTGAGGQTGPLRVVVVGSGESLAFQVQVEDAAKGAPVAAVVQAVDLDNHLVLVDGYRVVMHLGR